MTNYTPQDYRSKLKPTWCKGCSYYGVLVALTEVLAMRQIDPLKLTVISGIGCSSRMTLNLNTFGMHTLHGRAIPVAIGARLARPDIPVIVAAGDGDLFSIGIGHFVHAARKNFNITVICMDNRMYAMTKNQASPTSPVGYQGSLTPYGKLSVPLNMLEFALACEATFVSRTFAGSPAHMQKTLNSALDHKGFSFVEIIAPCRTFGKKTTIASLAPRIADINENDEHDTSNKSQAIKAAQAALAYDANPDAAIPVGIFWNVQVATFEELAASVTASAPQNRSIESILSTYAV